MLRPPDTLAAIEPATTLDGARRLIAALLREASCPTPDLDARILLCTAAGTSHADLISSPDRLLGSAAVCVRNLIQRRFAGEPVARIIGTREFWSLPLSIDPAVLDPRADTETLVMAVLSRIGDHRRDKPLRVLDLGTGSGAILCALLAEWPAATGVGIDRSPAACRIARRNCHQLGYADRAHIVCANWTAGIDARFDVIVSNPPYIATAEIATLAADVRSYDPLAALDGGLDGLVAYRALAGLVAKVAAPDAVIAFEIGSTQAVAVGGLMRAAGFALGSVVKDLAGYDRVVLSNV